MAPRYLIIYPSNQNWFTQWCGERVGPEIATFAPSLTLSAADFVERSAEFEMSRTSLIFINFQECVNQLSKWEIAIIRAQASRACQRILLISEAFQTKWFKNQFKHSIRWDSIVDLGYQPQASPAFSARVPVRFCFNGLTPAEERTLSCDFAEAAFQRRKIPWAMIGHQTPRRVRLVKNLMSVMGSDGFVFMPPVGLVKEQTGRLNSEMLKRILSETQYYVFCSHHQFPYLESFRYLDALLSGAIPLKIDPLHDTSFERVPLVFGSVEEASKYISGTSPREAFGQVVKWVRDGGSLGDNLRSVLDEEDFEPRWPRRLPPAKRNGLRNSYV